MLRRIAFAALTALLLLTAPTSAWAQDDRWRWEGSQAEEITAKSVDALIIRPLATIRVAVGAALMLPACLLASPSGREGIDGAYEVLLEEPLEYAFTREMGEF
ncbi:MAG: hypothetical protein JRG86_07615 [Deltaproteobacteria bacterium]|jgi:hypothetical protein|nr:hypothetical protein [Deltaproteobacteria bacterium]